MPNLSGDSGNIPRQLGGVSSRTIQSASMKTAATTDHRFPDAAAGESVIGAHLWAPGPDPGALRLGSDGPSEGPPNQLVCRQRGSGASRTCAAPRDQHACALCLLHEQPSV